MMIYLIKEIILRMKYPLKYNKLKYGLYYKYNIIKK